MRLRAATASIAAKQHDGVIQAKLTRSSLPRGACAPSPLSFSFISSAACSTSIANLPLVDPLDVHEYLALVPPLLLMTATATMTTTAMTSGAVEVAVAVAVAEGGF